MNSKFIQFRGAKAVLKAYDMVDAEAWAIFNGKELFTKGHGEEMLRQMLEMLGDSGCTYTLKVYEGIEADNLSSIKDKTAYDGSFTFRLTSDEEDYGPFSYSNKRNKLLQRIEDLEKINGIGVEEKEETMEDVVIGAIKEPWRLAELANTIKGLFNIGPGYVPQYGQNAIGATQPAQGSHTEQMVDRLETAINILERYDPNIIAHLEKLAKIAQGNPSQFNFLIKALENM